MKSNASLNLPDILVNIVKIGTSLKKTLIYDIGLNNLIDLWLFVMEVRSIYS